MWYEKTGLKELDYSKPIIAEDHEGTKHLLLPQIEKESYVIVGYNWFNIDRGNYNSSVTFKTAAEAIRSYSHMDVHNCKILIHTIDY